MRIRTVLPAIVLTAGVVVGATACEAGVEKKDKAAPATTAQSTGTPAPTSASERPSASTTPSTPTTPVAPKTGKADPSTPAAPITPKGNDTIVISGSGAKPTTDCTGRDVRIEGTTIALTLTGFCKSLTVTGGDGDSIEVAWFDRITVSGTNHLVMYGVKPDGSVPQISDNGLSNRITSRG
ncbi:DUF3060 domain-containing protein [Embleya hyalina]|uniref:Lipoprotein n=1 Tax=Embleya hyalina TaxID=516124 RepID=A0A401YV78_9ACTN|nr:DUF3060 domain-containing protein [Embleya hyalina]GCD98528.1 hypothetical protein EHYA_06235 [Embleya hyalina]